MENTECIEYIKQAFELKDKKLYKPAIEMLYKALELENDNVEILSQIGELYFLLNNYSRSLQYLEKVLQISPEHAQCLTIAGKIYQRQENWNEALNFAKKLYNAQQNADNLTNLIKILIQLKLFCEIEQYTQSEFFTQDVKIECANAYYKNGEKEKAKDFFRRYDTKNKYM